ncbi:MAG: serine/threonine-protein kinase [Thermoanaerobaculia bacterium]|nr:serine/threonine-protein kinase [Thermoanaerobaculia bacterium]
MPHSNDHLVGTTLDGKYQIESLLGSGGMGRVYKARHAGTGRPVAVKVITEGLAENSEVSLRFQREAKIAGSIRHPNVVDVTDFGISRSGGEGTAYLVMEYLQGQTLREILQAEKRLSSTVVIDVVEQIALALEQAHRLDIVHRDLKPENIWLVPESRGGYQVKVLDFGIAAIHRTATGEGAGLESPSTPSAVIEETSAVGSEDETPTVVQTAESTRSDGELRTSPDASTDATIVKPEESATVTPVHAGQITVAGSTLGTPLYMSPEQCRGEQADYRSDLYSLGVITFEAIAGRRPFEGSMIEVLNKHVSEQPPRLDQLVEQVSSAVGEVIDRSLSKEPGDRYPSASAFAGNLQVASEGATLTLRRALALYAERLDQFLPLILRACGPTLYLTALMLVGIFVFPFGRDDLVDLAAVFVVSIVGGALWTIIAVWSHSLFAFVIEQIRLRPLSTIDLGEVRARLLELIGARSRGFLSRTWSLFKFYLQCERHAPPGTGDLSFNIAALENLSPGEAGARAGELGKAVEKRYAWVRMTIFATLFLFPALGTALIHGIFRLTGLEMSFNLALSLFMTLVPLNAIWSLPVMSIAITLLYFRSRQAQGEDVPLGALVSTRL